jgi:predicted DNA-binding protein (UPF0251 family)
MDVRTLSLGSAGDWADYLGPELCNLPMRQAAALSLVYTFGLTQVEAADRLGLSIDEVRRLVSSALRALGRRISSTTSVTTPSEGGAQ